MGDRTVSFDLGSGTDQYTAGQPRRRHPAGPVPHASHKRLSMEQLYKLVAENTNDSISVSNLATMRTVYVSPSIEHVLGFTSEESVGKPPSFFLPPASVDLGMNVLQKHLAIERKGRGDISHSWVLEQEGYRRDGSVVWIESRCSLLQDHCGKVVGVITATRDIGERKLMEKALRDGEARYRSLLENSRDPICIVSRDGRVTDMNQAMLALFQYSTEEARTLELQTLAPALDVEKFQRVVERDGYVKDYEMQMRRNGGTQIDCLLTFTLRRSESGSILGYEGSIRDITEYKRLQHDLRFYVDQASHAQEEERRRIARELHDDTIQALATLSLELLTLTRGTAASADEALGTIEQIRRRIDSVAEGLGRLGRSLRPSLLDRFGLIPAITLLLRDLNQTGEIHVSLRVAGRERRLLPEAELGLFRIAQEATQNVRKHSGAKRASVTLTFGYDRVMLTIKDRGKGFKVPERLGDFSSAGRLGLMGMQERVHGLGGTLVVESHLGKGTTVAVEVPA